jgi:hypothetical protein
MNQVFSRIRLPAFCGWSLNRVQFTNSISAVGAILMGAFGFALTWFALRNGSRKPAKTQERGFQKDLDRLFTEISKGLRFMATPNRFGGMGLMREKQVEVERQLSELQRRLRHLEDGVRDKYEAKAHRILAQAARFGITLPPP